MTAPSHDQIEITVFGPGFGEAIVVHLGDNRWLLIDSCVHPSTGEPAALAYLSSIGVDASSAVRFVLATHWHDDHVRGLGQVVAKCQSAKFGCPTVFTGTEFLGFAAAFDKDPTSTLSGGSKEILSSFRSIGKRPIRHVHADRLLDMGTLADGREFSFWALSPSDLMYQEFLRTLIPPYSLIKQTKRRANPNDPNFASVVSRLDIGQTSFLFGADMQNHSSPQHGWNAIHASTIAARRSIFFKVPHHGSENAHDADTWTKLLVEQATAVVTPWRNGDQYLPQQRDVDRLRALTPNGFCTSHPDRRFRADDPAIERTVREGPITIRTLPQMAGWVRTRIGPTGTIVVDRSPLAFAL